MGNDRVLLQLPCMPHSCYEVQVPYWCPPMHARWSMPDASCDSVEKWRLHDCTSMYILHFYLWLWHTNTEKKNK
jgi:hypothetical protein